jgi:cobalt transporter subunit CbtB
LAYSQPFIERKGDIDMQSHAIARPNTALGTRASSLAQAIMAAMLGVFLIWGVGFSPIMAVHNAAHDTRHSSGFPCH